MSVIFSPWTKWFQQAHRAENVGMLAQRKLNLFSLFFGVLLLLVGVDYLINQSNGKDAASELAINLPTQSSRLQLTNGQDVVALYQQFDQPMPVPKQEVIEDSSIEQGEATMSIVKQANQAGLLSKLYIGDAIYRLSGIVKSGKYKAALSVSYVAVTPNKPSEQAEVEQSPGQHEQPLTRKTNISISIGDTLGPYQVEAISFRRVILTQQDRRLWLELFVPHKAVDEE